MPTRRFRAPQRQPITGRFRSRKPFVLLLGTVLGALVWFAPVIIANSPLKDRILAAATADFQGTISIGSISTGWLSEFSAKDFVAFDVNGERLAEAASIKLDKNLIALLRDRTDLGTIRVQQPVVNLVLRPDGSNIEDAIAPWLVSSDTPSDIDCTVEIHEGILQVTDMTTGSRWTATNLNGGIKTPNRAAAPLMVRVESDLNPPTGTTGKLQAELYWQPTGTSVGKGNLTVKATAVPLELASPGMQRLFPGVSASGLLEGDISLDWGGESGSARIGRLAIQDLRVVAPTWFGSDQIELDTLQASGEVTQRGGSWQVQQFAFDSDIGQLTAQGTASVQRSGELTSPVATITELLRYGQFQIDGQIDLARIARMLPGTLRIREGTYVATGDIGVTLGSKIDTNGQRWDGRIEAKNLSAMHEGRRLTWDHPIIVTVAAREANGMITLDELDCDSSFLQVVATGTSKQGTATLRGDLARFTTELSQFIDLGSLRTGGRLGGEIKWQTAEDQSIRLAASATAEQFELVSATRPAWREDRLVLQLTGVGTKSENPALAMKQCELRLQSGSDQLALSLFPRPTGMEEGTVVPASLRLTGSLRAWTARLQPVFALPGWNIDGTLDMSARANVAKDQVRIEQANIQLGHLRASNGTLFINEPVVKIDSQGTLDRQTGALNFPDATLVSSSISLRAANVDVHTDATGTQIAADVNYRGDVGKLAGLFHDPQIPASRQLSGQATGHALLRSNGPVTSCEWSTGVTEFVYAVPSTQDGGQGTATPQASSNSWETVWREPNLKLAATVAYDSTNGVLQVARVEGAGDAISFAARGKLSELTTRCSTELDGQLTYDLQMFASRFREQLGDRFQVAGRDTRPFSFRGPLFSELVKERPGRLHPVSTGGHATTVESAVAQMIARASFGWSTASVQGVAVGAGEVDATLSQGRLVLAPMKLAVSEGTVLLSPTVILDQSPMIVTLPAGPVVERVRITPRMCGSWLKYVAPLVADATAAQGEFSVSLQQAIIPVDTPVSGQAEGVIDIHSAQIGAGPLSQQLLFLAAQIKAIADGDLIGATRPPPERWLDLPSQRIAFRMADRRIYHRGLQMSVKDVVIRTSGSVGVDQTISLVAEVPIRDEWLSRNQYLAALRGQTIQIPIHGTLTSPKLDSRALDQITQQAVTGTANRYLQEGANRLDSELNKQLNRGLEKLFGTPR